MKKWKLMLSMVLILCAGICMGAAATGLYARHKILSVLEEGRPTIARLVTNSLDRRLDLSDSQRAEIEKIVNATKKRLVVLRMRIQPEAEDIIDDGFSQMKRELTAPQQEKLEIIHNRFKQRRGGSEAHSGRGN